MAKTCDNKSVGVLIEEDGIWRVIFRRNYPRAWAMVAGHVDDHGTEREAAKIEALEEIGLSLGRFVRVFQENIPNPCKRPGGTHHEWSVYEAYDWAGILRASSDAKSAELADQKKLLRLAGRTSYFARKHRVEFRRAEDVNVLTRAIFGDPEQNPHTDPEWEANPGLEPVWYYILMHLGKI